MSLADAKLVDRLVNYAKIDTQSDDTLYERPSTRGQKELGCHLISELDALGLDTQEFGGCVYAKLGGDTKTAPAIGFIAHLDTAPGVLAEGIEPRIHKNYSGGNILLEEGVVINETELDKYIGDTIITSDGRTFLGADDKAGISVILNALERITNDWNGRHGDIYIMFNPDEEIGRGLQDFNPEKFPVKAAYTIDATGAGQIECETFYAAKAYVTFVGRPTHPGDDGFQKLINPVSLACRFESSIPATERPETTNERLGFYYPKDISGTPEKAYLEILVRDFEKEGLDQRILFLNRLVDTLNCSSGKGTVSLDVEEQYPNMKATLDQHPNVVKIATEAMRKAGISEPRYPSMRGGTDGANLTVEYGIPTPNVSAGMHNIHSVKEFASLREMVAARDFVLNVVEAYAERSN